MSAQLLEVSQLGVIHVEDHAAHCRMAREIILRSRNGAPSRKGCVVNGLERDAKNEYRINSS